ncbi:THAP domain-containing protein 1-like [Ciona intestinalis]
MPDKRPVRGRGCVAYGCRKRKFPKTRPRSNSSGSEDEESEMKRKQPRTFHSFPKDMQKRKQWEVKLRLPKLKLTNCSLICSDHFYERDITRSSKNVMLKADAIPRRFKKFPKHLKEKPKVERKLPVRKIKEEIINADKVPKFEVDPVLRLDKVFSIEKDHQTLPAKISCHLPDHTYCVPSISVYVKKFHKNLASLEKSKHKLRRLRQHNNRLIRQRSKLKSTINQLRKKKDKPLPRGILQECFKLGKLVQFLNK